MQVNNLLKKALATSGMLLLCMSSAHAIPRGPCDQKPAVCCESPPPGPFGFTFPKDMDLACPMDFYFRGEFLALQPKQDGLDYAIADGTTPATLPITNGKVSGFSTGQNDWGWDFGARIAAGFYLNHDAWNMEIDWMWFKINEEVSTSVDSGGGLIPLWLIPVSENLNTSNERASSRWRLSMNVFDLILAKPFHTSRYMIFNPFFGLRGAVIDQDYFARYSGTFGGTGSIQTRAKNDFWGVGPTVGFRSEWLMSPNFRLLGDLGLAGLYGKFDMTQHAPGSSNGGYNYEHEFHRNALNLEMKLGFSWGMSFSDNRYYFSLAALYEFHQWWDQNWMRITQDPTTFVSDSVSRGDLSLNGVSIRFQFDF